MLASTSVADIPRGKAVTTMPEGSSSPGEPGEKTIVIKLTQANLKYNHLYLRKNLDFFPGDAIGGANKREEGEPLTLNFDGLPELVETDIAGDKKIFRCRLPWRMFFAHHPDLAEGGSVIIERQSDRVYRVSPLR